MEEWLEDEESREEIRSKFVGEYGDRHQELVFIGQGLDQMWIESILDACLVTGSEYAEGPDAWGDFDDPLPAIELEADNDMSGAVQ